MMTKPGYGFVLLLYSLLMYSCTNDMDLYTGFSPIPVVYCITDPTDSFCYVSISRTFQADTNAIGILKEGKMLRVDGAKITMEAWGGGYKLWETAFSPISNEVSDSSEMDLPRSIYRSDKILGFIDPIVQGSFEPWPYEFLRLLVNSSDFDQMAYSRIPILAAPIVMRPIRPMDLNLYWDDESYFSFIVNKNAVEYADFICEFYYKEYINSWIDKHIRFIIKKNMPIISERIIIRLYEDSFFNKIVANIDDNLAVYARLFNHMDFTLYISDRHFNNYFNTLLGQGNTEVSYYTNITNGLGIFSVKRKATVYDIKFDRVTLDSLCNGRFTRHLNFKSW